MTAPARIELDGAARARIAARVAEGRAALNVLGERLGPTEGLFLARATTDLVDETIARLAVLSREAVGREASIRDRDLLAKVLVVALGGYGRRELCPRSDVDLLFLLPRLPTELASEGTAIDGAVPACLQAFVNAILYALWDLGFEVGHAVRSVDDCVRTAIDDQSVLTALLDARAVVEPVVTGGKEASGQGADLLRELMQRLDSEVLIGARARELIALKLGEVKRRRERFGGSVFLLEPNVKESEGGLRDLHSALWVSRARWRARGVRDLLQAGVLSPHEGRALERAYGFLLRVRSQLHLVVGRRQDILGYEFQEPVARALGYVTASMTDAEQRNHGVERFMRAYYYQARQIRVHSELVIERATTHTRRRPAYLQTAPGGFKVWDDTLTVADRGQFEREPVAIVRIFRVAQEECLPIYSYTKDLIAESRHRIDSGVRRTPEAVGEFLGILEDPTADGSILDLMHDLGVLIKLVPELSRVTARWQRSLYHVYTVDVHSLMVVKNLKRLRNGSLANEEPELARLMSVLPRPNVLYLAGLLHDVGKGWPRADHSEKGAIVARTVGGRLEAARLSVWTHEETEDLEWLVKSHLAMSDISQRRDASDLELVGDFAASAGSTERLTMLYLLTYADMKGTSPKVWTDWKGALLKELFTNAVTLIEHSERGETVDIQAHVLARRERAHRDLVKEAEESGASASPETIAEFVQAMPPRYMMSFPPRRMLRHLAMWRNVADRRGVDIHVRPLRREDTTELTVACPDRPGLLALLAGTLSANRLQILSAHIFSIECTQAARVAIDVLFVKDETGRICDDASRWDAVQEDLRAFVLGDEDVRALVKARVRGTRRLRRPKPVVKTEVHVSNSVSKTETVIDVFCQDHLGVLYTIAQALADQGLTISLAKISTQGDRVADGFYVTDAETGRKIEDQARLSTIRRSLEVAIEEATDS